MILWTVQPDEALKILESEGVLTAKKKHEDPDYFEPYRWMKKQMARRVGKPEFNDQALLWAWYQYTSSKKRRPDLRSSHLYYSGQFANLIEFEIDPKQVLLSDFNTWYHVLGCYYLPLSEEEDRIFERFHNDTGCGWNELPPTDTFLMVESSWNRIFDLDWYDPYVNSPREEKQIQATFWKLELSQVRSVKRFKAR